MGWGVEGRGHCAGSSSGPAVMAGRRQEQVGRQAAAAAGSGQRQRGAAAGMEHRHMPQRTAAAACLGRCFAAATCLSACIPEMSVVDRPPAGAHSSPKCLTWCCTRCPHSYPPPPSPHQDPDLYGERAGGGHRLEIQPHHCADGAHHHQRHEAEGHPALQRSTPAVGDDRLWGSMCSCCLLWPRQPVVDCPAYKLASTSPLLPSSSLPTPSGDPHLLLHRPIRLFLNTIVSSSCHLPPSPAPGAPQHPTCCPCCSNKTCTTNVNELIGNLSSPPSAPPPPLSASCPQ